MDWRCQLPLLIAYTKLKEHRSEQIETALDYILKLVATASDLQDASTFMEKSNGF